MSVGCHPQAAAAQQGVGGDDIEFIPNAYNFFDFRLGAAAEAGIRTQSDGTIDRLDSNSPQADVGTWYTGGATAADYDIRLDYVSGDHINSGDAEDTWFNANSQRSWSVVAAMGFNTEVFSGTLRVRPTGGGADIDTATVDLSANTEL